MARPCDRIRSLRREAASTKLNGGSRRPVSPKRRWASDCPTVRCSAVGVVGAQPAAPPRVVRRRREPDDVPRAGWEPDRQPLPFEVGAGRRGRHEPVRIGAVLWAARSASVRTECPSTTRWSNPRSEASSRISSVGPVDREDREPTIGEVVHGGRLDDAPRRRIDLELEHGPASPARHVRERIGRRLEPRRAAVDGPDRRDDVDELGETGDRDPVRVAQERDQQAADDQRVGQVVRVLGQGRRPLEPADVPRRPRARDARSGARRSTRRR